MVPMYAPSSNAVTELQINIFALRNIHQHLKFFSFKSGLIIFFKNLPILTLWKFYKATFSAADPAKL
jgi:hypothetical protein